MMTLCVTFITFICLNDYNYVIKTCQVIICVIVGLSKCSVGKICGTSSKVDTET